MTVPAQSLGSGAGAPGREASEETRSRLVEFARPARSLRSLTGAPAPEHVSRSRRLLHHDGLAALAAHPFLRAILVDAVSDARGLAAVRADDHHLAQPEWHGLVDDPALLILRGMRLGVALGDVQPRHDDRTLRRSDLLHAAALAAVLPGDDHHFVALAQPKTCHHRTSGASETIFMKFRSRSSRATGPKMRVPRGWFCGLSSTAALSSKRMSEPSLRRYSLV